MYSRYTAKPPPGYDGTVFDRDVKDETLVFANEEDDGDEGEECSKVEENDKNMTVGSEKDPLIEEKDTVENDTSPSAPNDTEPEIQDELFLLLALCMLISDADSSELRFLPFLLGLL